MGCLVFLAFESADAFALDIGDKFACPLCVDGQKQPYPLFEAGTKWLLKWPWSYSKTRGHIYFKRIDGGDSSDLPWMKASAVERGSDSIQPQAGTNRHR